MTVAENIKRIRKEKNLTQKQLGEKCGMSESTLRQYEIGYRNPKLETIRRIAAALDVYISDLVDDWGRFSKEEIEQDIENGSKESTWNYSKAEEYFEYSARKLEEILIEDYRSLNNTGKGKAVEQVKLLTKIPEYQKEPPEE